MNNFNQYSLTEHQFAQLIGKSKLYQCLPPKERKQLPNLARALYFKRKNIKVLHQNQRRMSLIYGQNHKGGAFIANTEKYKQTGMENEKFYGWGPEDYERYDRWINLGFRIYHAPGCMYHLSHPRDINGRFNSQRQMEITRSELAKTRKSSFKESAGG